jgi:hypothetical protein
MTILEYIHSDITITTLTNSVYLYLFFYELYESFSVKLKQESRYACDLIPFTNTEHRVQVKSREITLPDGHRNFIKVLVNVNYQIKQSIFMLTNGL